MIRLVVEWFIRFCWCIVGDSPAKPQDADRIPMKQLSTWTRSYFCCLEPPLKPEIRTGSGETRGHAGRERCNHSLLGAPVGKDMAGPGFFYQLGKTISGFQSLCSWFSEPPNFGAAVCQRKTDIILSWRK